MSLRTFRNLIERDSSLATGAKHAAKQLVREAVGRYIGLFPFKRQPLLDKKTVILVDGSQEISTQDMGILLKNAQRAGSKIILIGSPDGLQAIERGVPFASFVRRFRTAKLTEIVRPEQRQLGVVLYHVVTHREQQSTVNRLRSATHSFSPSLHFEPASPPVNSLLRRLRNHTNQQKEE